MPHDFLYENVFSAHKKGDVQMNAMYRLLGLRDGLYAQRRC